MYHTCQKKVPYFYGLLLNLKRCIFHIPVVLLFHETKTNDADAAYKIFIDHYLYLKGEIENNMLYLDTLHI